MDEPTLRTEIEREIAEHEVFLSFVNDIDAELFHDWWNAKGFKLFEKWADHEKSERGE